MNGLGKVVGCGTVEGCVAINTPLHCKRQNDRPGTVDFSGLPIVHKFARRLTPNLDFKVAISFNIKYLENGTRQNYYYNGRLKESRT